MGQDYSYSQPSSSSASYDITSQLQAEADLYAEEYQSNYNSGQAVQYQPQPESDDGILSICYCGDVFVLQNSNEAEKTKETTTAATMNDSIIHGKGVQQELEDRSKHGDLSYVASKRKVPRGPDPIHNRRAGSLRRPPGRA